MRMRKRFIYFITALFCLLTALGAAAQSEAEITIHDEIALEGGDALSLDVYFSLRDGEGQPLPQAEVASASLLLEDGSQAEASLAKPPYYIALVIDTSGSMQDVMEEVRQAATAAIEAAPAEVQFAVIRFDERINLFQPFTSNNEQAISAVNQMEMDERGTCLYDVAFTAVQALEQIARDAPRRAMILFTDGRDEIRQGAKDTCSQNTYDQLVAFATSRPVPVPIHTVGLAGRRGRVNATELSNLSQVTGGRAVVGNGDVWSDLFQQVMDDVSSQWLAQAELYPTLGQHRGALFVTLADGRRPLSGPVQFNSSRNYQLPPEPVALSISNYTYNEVADLFFFDVALTSTQNIGSLQIEVVDNQSNLQIERLIISDPASRQQIRLPASALSAGHDYTTRITPLSLTGNPIKGEDSQPLLAEHPFRYDPPEELTLEISGVAIQDAPPALNMRTLSIIDDQAELTINLQMENSSLVDRIEGRLINQQGNVQQDAFSLDRPAAELTVPLNVGLGTYTIVIDALDERGQLLASARSTFSYTPQDSPLNQTVTAWRENPILTLLGLVLMLIVAVLAWLLGVFRGQFLVRRALARAQRDEVVAPVAARPAPASSNGQAPKVKLRVVESPEVALVNEQARELHRFPFTIGREGCDLTIPGDRHISRKHARITYENGLYYIEDAGSSNGTFVNEVRINAHTPTPLNPITGSRIRIGFTTQLTFGEHADEMAQRTTSG